MTRSQVQTPAGRCRFGLGVVDITPPANAYHRNWGAAAHDAAEGIHRPLQAAAAVMAPADEPGEHVLLTLDLGWLRAVETRQLLARLQELAGLAPPALTVTFSHTHSAVNLDLDRAAETGGEHIAPYLAALPGRLLQAVTMARQSMSLVDLTYATGRCSLAANRDHWDAAGGLWTCGTDPDGATDDHVQLVRVQRADGEPVAVVVNYACHPTTLAWTNRLISPDYIGALREVVTQATGVPCLFVLGPCGDLGPRDGFVGDPAVADRNGRQLGYAALAALESMPPPATTMVYQGPVVSGATLGIWTHEPVDANRSAQLCRFRSTALELDLDCRPVPTPEAVAAELTQWQQAQDAASGRGDVAEAAVCRARVERCRRLQRRLEDWPADGRSRYRALLWQVGDGVWVWLNGEPYNVLQRELRQRFPATPLVFGVLCNQPHAYILPRDRAGLGLYQEECSSLAPGALEAIIEAIAAQLRAWGQR